MVSNSCRNVPVSVMNVAGYPVTMSVGAVLTDLAAVELVGNP